MTRVLVVATSRKTRGGITSVIKAHETGEQWKKFHCRWIETHRDGPEWRKIAYFLRAFFEFIFLLPFYDIVHIHVGLRASVRRKIIFAKCASVAKKKVIIHFHPSTEKHLFDPQLSVYIKNLFDCANIIIVLSPQWVKWINEAYLDRHYVFEILHNPCPQIKGDLPSMEIRHKYILFAGTLNDRKGYNRLLEAFSRICDKYLDWKLLFAGNGEIEKAKSLQEKLNISQDQVEYLGWIEKEEKDNVFKNASIYCLPSWGEGFPMGVLDAIAYGIPVITTPVGGITDLMSNGKNCLIYNIFDIEELSDCLEKLIVDEQLRVQLSKEASILCNNELEISNICKQLGNIYAKLT